MIYYGLLLFFVLEYMRPATYFRPAAILYTIVPAAVILGTLVGKSDISNGEVLRDRNSWLLGGLLTLVVTSFLVADNSFYAFNTFTTVLGYTLLYWVVFRQTTNLARLKGLFAILIFIHVALALLTPQMFLDPGTRHYIASGTFLGDGNDYALSVLIATPFCLYLISESRSKVVTVILGVTALFLVLCVVLTQSRGGTLGLVAVGAYYWLKTDRKVLTGSLAVFTLVMVFALAPGAYFERMNSLSNVEADGSAQGRITMWQAGVAMALSNPLLGVGAGQFPPNSVKFAPEGPDGPQFRWKTAHSIYFLILGELGFTGLGLLIAIIVGNIRQNRAVIREIGSATGSSFDTYRRLLSSLNASMLAYAVAGAFLSATYYPHMYVLAGLMSAARRQARAAVAGQASQAVISDQIGLQQPPVSGPTVGAERPSIRAWRPRPSAARRSV